MDADRLYVHEREEFTRARLRGERLKNLVDFLVGELELYGHLQGDRQHARMVMCNVLAGDLYGNLAIDLPSFPPD
jgi:hypothetical protein